MAVGRKCRIGIDVGGTFTDFVLADLHERRRRPLQGAERPRRPLAVGRARPGRTAGAGRRAAGRCRADRAWHDARAERHHPAPRRASGPGRLEGQPRTCWRSGARGSPNSYDFHRAKEEPLVPRDLVLEIGARMRADGAVLEAPASPARSSALAAQLRRGRRRRRHGAAAAFLRASRRWSRRSPRSCARSLPGVPVTASARIWPERREYERSPGRRASTPTSSR